MPKSVTFAFTTEHGRTIALEARFAEAPQGVSVAIDVLAVKNELSERDIFAAEQQALDYYTANHLERDELWDGTI